MISFFFSLLAGAVRSYFLQPVYLSSITIGQIPNSSKNIPVVDHLRRALYERIQPLSNKLTSPFQVNKVVVMCMIFFVLWEVTKAVVNFILLRLAATILWCSNTTKGVSAFWDCYDHFNMWVSFIWSCSCRNYYFISFYRNALYFNSQVFFVLEQVWLAWSHSWNYWQKARHLCKRSNVPFYRIILMQVSN